MISNIKKFIQKIRYKIFPIMWFTRYTRESIFRVQILSNDFLNETALKAHHIHYYYSQPGNFYNSNTETYSTLFQGLQRNLWLLDRTITESRDEYKNSYFLTNKKMNYLFTLNDSMISIRGDINRLLSKFEKGMIKKEIKRIYSPVDPYGEENWEE